MSREAASFVEVDEIEATDNLHVRCIRPLVTPAVCIEDHEVDAAIRHQVCAGMRLSRSLEMRIPPVWPVLRLAP